MIYQECRVNPFDKCPKLWFMDACPVGKPTGSGIVIEETAATPPACENQCQKKGARVCNAGEKNYKTCEDSNGDGCLELIAGSCPGDTVNNYDCECMVQSKIKVIKPSSGCDNECDAIGRRQCAAGEASYKTCADGNSDGCLELVAGSCPGKALTNSDCECVDQIKFKAVTPPNTCKDECDTIGHRFCGIGDASYKECQYDQASGCLKLAMVNCGVGTTTTNNHCECGCPFEGIWAVDPAPVIR